MLEQTQIQQIDSTLVFTRSSVVFDNGHTSDIIEPFQLSIPFSKMEKMIAALVLLKEEQGSKVSVTACKNVFMKDGELCPVVPGLAAFVETEVTVTKAIVELSFDGDLIEIDFSAEVDSDHGDCIYALLGKYEPEALLAWSKDGGTACKQIQGNA